MKKLFVLFLILAVCLSVCACGKSEANLDAVDNALQGKWEKQELAVYNFNNGSFKCESFIAGISLGVKTGTYEVTSTEIVLTYDDGIESSLEYTFDNGVITFASNDMKKAN